VDIKTLPINYKERSQNIRRTFASRELYEAIYYVEIDPESLQIHPWSPRGGGESPTDVVIVTVCLVFGLADSDVKARGVAVKVPKDLFNRKDGLYRSRERALEALDSHESKGSLAAYRKWFSALGPLSNGSMYNMDLTAYESKIVRTVREKVGQKRG